MKSARILLFSLLMVLSSLACTSIDKKLPETDVLFFDDFSSLGKRWNQVSSDAYSTNYIDEAYRITVNETNKEAWARPGKQDFTDTHIEVDATQNSGPDDNDFGVLCRYTDPGKFYYGVISSDGYYAIMKMTASGGALLGNKHMGESDKIVKGAATNHIRFDCVGSTLTLYVNGNQVDQQTDTEYTSGNVGLLAGTFSEPGVDILFDNFIVFKP